ncbi:MAG: hypothetical protein QGH73_04650 [Rhodospirillales bacterium]|jgi:chromosome segregation ATPase|nr:hypothetical protein [Rhodospirillaceae bacterium]MDP6427129.1 hypothetical protein [Rhodospirillales bacterium]MDP6646644.1 hypothetical protein [Rhodospirillales bacterium]MDP6840945.1 hypothetical protein [Rhodospirillales bacterium]|tara:strand:- start:242 stop:943 length:702 start_codon:yes stop_codon:yes gene_type:complete
MKKLILLGLILLLPGMASGPAMGQSAPPGGEDPNKEFKETQAFIKKTQSKIDRVRTETEARAKEIEALATRVGDIISAMSSQGEDNSNLISEISVLNELLTIERQTTTGLRKDVEELGVTLDAKDAAHKKAETDLKEAHLKETEAAAKREAALSKDVQRAQDITRAAQKNLTAAEKKLDAALQSIAGHAKTNRVLVSDIDALRKQVSRLKREIQMVRRRKSPSRIRRKRQDTP